MMICRLFCIWYVSALPNLVKKNRNDDSAVFVRTSDVVNHIIDFFLCHPSPSLGPICTALMQIGSGGYCQRITVTYAKS